MSIQRKQLNNVINPSIYEEVLIKSADTEIALSLWKSNKDDSCIIFLPGTMTHPIFYDDFLNQIAVSGFNVIGVHPVSHGKSPRVKDKFSFNDMLQNTKDAISYAIERFNDKIILMGSSQGGVLTIALAGIDNRIKAAFPHNIMIPSLRESIRVTSFPSWFEHFYKVIVASMKLGAFLFPKMQLPISFYLDDDRIFTDGDLKNRFYQDPLSLTSYPLYFLTSLFTADMSQISDGSIKCPVVVIASTGDPLFSFEYSQKVFDMIKAPHKEMLVVNENSHLIMNECVERVAPIIISKLKEAANKI